MRFKKPQLIPSLFIIASTVLLSSLGMWQLERLQWKSTLLADIKNAQSQPALEKLPLQPEGLAYRKATLSGSYLTQKTLHFVGSKADGYVWLVPLKEKGGKQMILVSAGWFPASATDAKLTVPVAGTLRPMRQPRLFSPPNQPERNIWFSEDKVAIETATGLSLYPLILDLKPMPPLRNDHLGYAITWFALALVGIIMFIFYHRLPTRNA